ncbi:MAG: hypothetical protein L6R42_003247 [Xanthoria sp. 1 TBL-2021]|nr:MAG: hypothetical protein L6R42_003247 [Xanthoria sp. 1 TBL-2021]
MSSHSGQVDYKALMSASDKLLEGVIRWMARNAPFTGTGKQKGYKYFKKVLLLAPNVRDNGTRIPEWVVNDLHTALDLRKSVGEHNDKKAEREKRHDDGSHNDRRKREKDLKMIKVMEECLRILTTVYEQQPLALDGDPTSVEQGSAGAAGASEMETRDNETVIASDTRHGEAQSAGVGADENGEDDATIPPAL